VISSKTDKSYSVFSLRIDKARSPRTGREHNFFILEASPWINVIPLTEQNEVVLVRQYRHGIRRVTLEIPGGLAETHETPEEAAKRELLEETGYKASEMILLGSVHPNSAILNNQCFTFIAENAFYAGEPQQDEKEDIEVQLRPLAEIPRLIREGDINHALVLAAFYRFYMEYKNVGGI
jgi:8-oxo-dGTP pyrophosphatase MutT (NUDIX family)